MSDVQEPSYADFIAAVMKLANEVGRSVMKQLEGLQPFIREPGRIAALPEVQAEMRRREALRDRGLDDGCHCLCGKVHPDDKGICDGEPVMHVNRWTELTGDVEIPTCAPCAAALMVITAQPG